IDYVKQESPPIVIKADGLAAGKGVIISQSIDDAITSIESLMDNKSLGTAGDQVIVEEYMNGREISMFVFTDGQTLSPPVTACDYKRIFDSNEGPNTGGMGSFSPANSYSNELGEKVFHEIMRPTVRALASENSPFCGVLYGGLMITDKGPRTIEFNCRLGDPETQVIMPRLNSDLVDIACAVIEKRLGTQPILWSNNPCVGVVMASAGYPGDYPTGLPISGLEDVDKDILIFHAGTKVGPAGEILTAGGRVLTVVAQGSTLFEARQKVYNNLPRINFDGAHYRTDIAQF
ncbi:MAG: phosphoribosylamine--glycine ligase, partial [Dehalococcoidia bacterium]|nr:phosphoribosylamine--glycine ligase [Dehalococcoidia bacterium]